MCKYNKLQSSVFTVIAIGLGLFNIALFPFNQATTSGPSKTDSDDTSSHGISILSTMEAYDANQIILNITVTDTEMLGRVSEDSQIDIAFNPTTQNYSYQLDTISYDAEEQTIIYQVQYKSKDLYNAESIAFTIKSLRSNKFLSEIPIAIDLLQEVMSGEHNGLPYSDHARLPDELLKFGYCYTIPRNSSTPAWISAIGINHGYVTIQVGESAKTNNEKIRPYLLDNDGNRIDSNASAGRRMSQQEILSIAEIDNGSYKLTEYYFSMDEQDLDKYVLYFEDPNWTVVSGNWEFELKLK